MTPVLLGFYVLSKSVKFDRGSDKTKINKQKLHKTYNREIGFIYTNWNRVCPGELNHRQRRTFIGLKVNLYKNYIKEKILNSLLKYKGTALGYGLVVTNLTWIPGESCQSAFV